jgi:biopolymer transport protein ExbD
VIRTGLADRWREHRRAGSGAIGLAGLTPFLDTIFLLLFALLALSDARTANRTELLRVELPAVEPADDAPRPLAARLVIEIDASSRVLLADSGRAAATPEELDGALRELLGEALPEEVTIEIQADRDARHGVAVALLQHLRLRGFVNVELVALGVSDGAEAFGGDPSPRGEGR